MKNPLLIVIVIALLTSCQAVYLPNIRNTPLFSKKGEVQGLVTLGINGYDVQTAVAVTDHVGAMANYTYLDHSVGILPYQTHAWYYEGGLGYYKNFDNKCLEVFAGYGTGEGNAQTQDPGPGLGTSQMPSGPVSGEYNKIFIQPSFGLKREIFHLGLTCRISDVNFTHFVYIDKPLQPSHVMYLEPAVTGKINFSDNQAFFFFQAGFNVSIERNERWESASRYARYLDLSVGIGLRPKLNKK